MQLLGVPAPCLRILGHPFPKTGPLVNSYLARKEKEREETISIEYIPH